MSSTRAVVPVDEIRVREIVAEMLAELPGNSGELRSMWRPLGDEPHDGTLILLFNSDQQTTEAGFWNADRQAFEVTLGDLWSSADCSLWMPMPSPGDQA